MRCSKKQKYSPSRLGERAAMSPVSGMEAVFKCLICQSIECFKLALAVVAVESVFFRKLNLLLHHYQESKFIGKEGVGKLLSLVFKRF